MEKKEYAEKKHSHTVLEILLIITLTLSIISYIIIVFSHNATINDLKEELASMPHYECYDESTTKSITLISGEQLISWEGNENYECEDGVLIDYFKHADSFDIKNWEDEPKTCLVTKTEEVCGIVRPSEERSNHGT